MTRNWEIGNTPIWILANIWRLGQVRNNKFGTNVSNKILLNAAKCQGCSSFYHFWVIKNKGIWNSLTFLMIYWNSSLDEFVQSCNLSVVVWKNLFSSVESAWSPQDLLGSRMRFITCHTFLDCLEESAVQRNTHSAVFIALLTSFLHFRNLSESAYLCVS